MDGAVGWSLLAVAALVGANGFFVAAEFALVTVRKTRIEQLAGEGHSTAKVVRRALEQLDRYIAGTQVGITLASLALGWIGEPALANLITRSFNRLGTGIPEAAAHTAAVAIAFTIITFLHVILGELVPKSVALQKPEATTLAVARPLRIIVTLFQPLIWSLNGLGNLLLRVIGLKAADGHTAVHSSHELMLLVKESHKAGILDDLEKRMLQRTLRFSETTVAQVMVPRAEMTALDLAEPFDTLIDKASNAQHSRLPVYSSSIDQIEGILYVQDLFRISRQPGHDLRKVIRKPLYVPETMHLDELIERFTSNNVQLAIIIDEHGGTAGLVTLENIIEAVFGRIQDQNEDQTPDIVSAPDGSVTIRGDVRIIDLIERYGWALETDEVDTIGGYMMLRLGRVPSEGDETDVGRHRFRVTKMERHRVVEVVVSAGVRHPEKPQ